MVQDYYYAGSRLPMLWLKAAYVMAQNHRLYSLILPMARLNITVIMAAYNHNRTWQNNSKNNIVLDSYLLGSQTYFPVLSI